MQGSFMAQHRLEFVGYSDYAAHETTRKCYHCGESAVGSYDASSVYTLPLSYEPHAGQDTQDSMTTLNARDTRPLQRLVRCR